jgi:uncharacterized protein YjlB
MRKDVAMPAVETLKKIAEKATGWARPTAADLGRLIRERKPRTILLKDDGLIPNHPHWPLILYRGAVRQDGRFDPAAVFEELFASNGWGNSWRNGIYHYVHYHSRTHEVLGIARGQGKAKFGGLRGTTVTLKAGDVAIRASDDFLVIGAYPPNGTYDECRKSEAARKRSRPSLKSPDRPRTRSSAAAPC